MNRQPLMDLLRIITLDVIITLSCGSGLLASDSVVLFDLPTTVPAQVNPSNSNQVTVILPLSSMIDDPTAPKIDQWLVTCRPRQSQLSIADYSPKTEAASDTVSPVVIKEIDEVHSSFGLTINGSYAPVVHGGAGSDQSEKNVHSREYSQAAPMQTVSAAGTVDRGSGVYFKLRRTATQVLEGERRFHITLDVPRSWRGGLIDVTAEATRSEKKFGSFSPRAVIVGAAHFVVAIYPSEDREAQSLARILSTREHALRTVAKRHQVDESPFESLPSMLRFAARKFRSEDDHATTRAQWLSRLLVGKADPHLDKAITKLPMPVRVAALDYVDARDRFQRPPTSTQLAANRSADHSYVSQPSL